MEPSDDEVIFRKTDKNEPLVWKKKDSVFKVVVEPEAELGVFIMAIMTGNEKYIVPLRRIKGKKREFAPLWIPGCFPEGIGISNSGEECGLEIPLNSGSVAAMFDVVLEPGVVLEMQYCGNDVEKMKPHLSLDRKLEIANETIDAVSRLCSAGLWPSDIRLSNIAVMKSTGKIGLLDYRGVWAEHLGVPAISSMVVQTLFFRDFILPESRICKLLGEFSDATMCNNSSGSFLDVDNIGAAVALSTKLAIAELFGFQDTWLVFNDRIDTLIPKGPSAKLCIANNEIELIKFRIFVSPRSPFVEKNFQIFS